MAGRATRFAALAIVCGVAASTVFVWASLPPSTGVDCHRNSSGSNPPLGTALAFGSPAEKKLGSDHWYNFSVQSAGGGLRWKNLDFQVQSSTGTGVRPGSGWSMTLLNYTGAVAGTYALTGAAAGNWTSGGETYVWSQQALSLLATPENLSGDLLVVQLVGSFFLNGCPVSGSLSVSIP